MLGLSICRLIWINDDRSCAPQFETARKSDLPGLFHSFQVYQEEIMDKDRIVGSAKEIKGKVKQVVGKAVGDAKLESEGKADRGTGKVQNVIGGLKDTLKGK
jgi:uncharacterized protein YjbJ (UPF0337 family)